MDVSPIRHRVAFLMAWIPAMAFTWYCLRCIGDGISEGFTWMGITKTGAAGFLAVTAWLNVCFRWWRPMGKARPGYCLKCDYDLTGNISGTCPECGRSIDLRDR